MDRYRLKDVLLSQHLLVEENIVERSLAKKVNEFMSTPFIIIISGIRRCGKTTLLKTLKDDGAYYVNFDDDRFIDMTLEDLDTLYNLLIELHGPKRTILLDEIQNVPGWERFVRRLHDDGMKILVTGSNAAMLSRELGTHLTGRHISLTLYPFSFGEYLSFKGIGVPPLDRMTSRDKSRMVRAFSEYMSDGGFPEYLRTGKEEYLQSLFQNILYRDIITRYNLTSEIPIKETALFAASNISKEMSFNTVKKITGLSSATTVKEYYGYLENSFLCFLVPRYDHSAKKQIYYNKKLYFIDTGLARLVGFRPGADRGRLLENMVYLGLRRTGSEIYFHRGKGECDLLLRTGGKITAAVQVTMDLSGTARDRELNGLSEACKLYGLDHGLILTYDQEGSLEVGGIQVTIQPVWQWLLENEV